MSETPDKNFGEKIKEFFKNPKKVTILFAVLVFIGIGVYFIINFTKKKKDPTPSPPGPGPGPTPGPKPKPGIKWSCIKGVCNEDSKGSFDSQWDCLNAGCCASSSAAKTPKGCNQTICCKPGQTLCGPSSTPPCMCVTPIDPKSCKPPNIKPNGTILSPGSKFDKSVCGGQCDINSNRDACLMTKSSCESGHWDLYANGLCMCKKDCKKIPYCQLTDENGKCVYPPNDLIKGDKPILHYKNSSDLQCLQPSLADIELACTNCANGKGLDGKSNTNCVPNPPIKWESDISWCVDTTSYPVIIIVMDKKDIISTDQISGTMHYTLQGTDTSTIDLVYIYQMTASKQSDIMGFVTLYDVGTQCGNDKICEKFIIHFDSNNKPVENVQYDFTISAMSDKDITSGQEIDYYAKYLTKTPSTFSLKKGTGAPGVYSELTPQLSLPNARTAAQKQGNSILGKDVKLPKKDPSLPIIPSSPGPYVVCAALDKWGIAEGNTIVILGWDLLQKSDITKIQSKCSLSSSSKVYYHIDKSEVNQEVVTWNSIHASDADTNKNWDWDLSKTKSNYIYRIAAYLKGSSGDFATSTCRSPFVYVTVETPGYDYDVCKSIPSSYSSDAGFSKDAVPPYLVPGSNGKVCYWPPETEDGIKIKDAYCLLESSNRPSSTTDAATGQPESCSKSKVSCKDGYINPQYISMYSEGDKKCKQLNLNGNFPEITYDGSSEKDWSCADFSKGDCQKGHINNRTLTCPTKMVLGEGQVSLSKFKSRITKVTDYIKDLYPKESVDPNTFGNTDWSKNFICCPFADSTKSDIQPCNKSGFDPSTWGVTKVPTYKKDDWDYPGNKTQLGLSAKDVAHCNKSGNDAEDKQNVCGPWDLKNSSSSGDTWTQQRNCWPGADNQEKLNTGCCSNEGTFSVTGGNGTCACKPGYGGPTCANPPFSGCCKYTPYIKDNDSCTLDNNNQPQCSCTGKTWMLPVSGTLNTQNQPISEAVENACKLKFDNWGDIKGSAITDSTQCDFGSHWKVGPFCDSDKKICIGGDNSTKPCTDDNDCQTGGEFIYAPTDKNGTGDIYVNEAKNNSNWISDKIQDSCCAQLKGCSNTSGTECNWRYPLDADGNYGVDLMGISEGVGVGYDSKNDPKYDPTVRTLINQSDGGQGTKVITKISAMDDSKFSISSHDNCAGGSNISSCEDIAGTPFGWCTEKNSSYYGTADDGINTHVQDQTGIGCGADTCYCQSSSNAGGKGVDDWKFNTSQCPPPPGMPDKTCCLSIPDVPYGCDQCSSGANSITIAGSQASGEKASGNGWQYCLSSRVCGDAPNCSVFACDASKKTPGTAKCCAGNGCGWTGVCNAAK